MSKMFPRTALLAAFAMLCLSDPAGAVIVTGGSASITFTEGVANPIGWLDSYFSAAKTRAESLADATPGNVTIDRLSGTPGTLGTSTVVGVPGTPGSVVVDDPIRPFGEVPLNDLGGTTPGQPGGSRTRQATTLDFDPNNLLGTWSTSSDDFGSFVGFSILGEQIALTNMQRWGGPFTGALLYGDFALRYTGTKLSLTTNIDFLNAEFARIGNPQFSLLDSDTLQITGDLLVGGGLGALDASAAPLVGIEDFGVITITANFAAVPEAGAFAFVLVATAATAGVGMHRMRRSRAATA